MTGVTGLRPFTERRRRIDASVVKDKIYYYCLIPFEERERKIVTKFPLYIHALHATRARV